MLNVCAEVFVDFRMKFCNLWRCKSRKTVENILLWLGMLVDGIQMVRAGMQ